MSEQAKSARKTGIPGWGAAGWVLFAFGLFGAFGQIENAAPVVLGIGGAVIGTGGLIVSELRRLNP